MCKEQEEGRGVRGDRTPAISRPDANEPPRVVGLVHVDTEWIDAVLVLDVDEVGGSVTIGPSRKT